jgi:isopenicillin-N N-acyltransferase-like protein
MDNSRLFPELVMSGDARSRGVIHGEQLREEIAETLDYYRGLFGLSSEALRQEAVHFSGIIRAFSEEYAVEIDAIAAAANIEPLYIYALNSRSEIYNNASIGECTAVYNQPENLLAQNWDWSQPLENLVVLARLEYGDNHRVCMLTEPGIIGKIGMNNRGIGACLNILKQADSISGLPVHVFLRAVLDCRNFHEVVSLLDLVNVGKASHVLFADAVGNGLGVEFAGLRSSRLEPVDGLLLHTNHYLAPDFAAEPDAFPTTHERLARAGEMLAERRDGEGIRDMLCDQSRGEASICRPYSPSASAGFGDVGTVFTVLMHLSEGRMEIRRGPGDGEFYPVAV